MTHERMGAGEVRDYIAYLLRLWREKGGASTRWRASLQDPHSGERVGFASLEELFGYLRRETDDQPESSGNAQGDEGEDA
jgi:hypothetical protein